MIPSDNQYIPNTSTIHNKREILKMNEYQVKSYWDGEAKR